MDQRLRQQCVKFDAYTYQKVLEGYDKDQAELPLIIIYRDEVPSVLKKVLYKYQGNLLRLKEIGCDSP